jgi:hypothetical protein
MLDVSIIADAKPLGATGDITRSLKTEYLLRPAWLSVDLLWDGSVL